MDREELKKHLLEILPKNPHGRLLLSQRSGKTSIIINLIKRDKPKSILWVSPSKKLINEDIPGEFRKWKALSYLKRVTTSTYASLHKIKGYFDWIILDEEQYVTKANILNFLNKELKYNNIISMTGKGSSHQEKKDIYINLNLEVLYNLPLKEANQIVSDYSINVINTKMSKVRNIPIMVKNTGKIFYTSEYLNYKYLNEKTEEAISLRLPSVKWKILNRMRSIYNSKSKEEKLISLLSQLEGQRNMIFCSNIEQANRLGENNTYHSKTNKEALKRFIKHEIKEIYLVNAGGVGFTYDKIDNLIIIQVDSNKNGLSQQKIARTLLLQDNYKAKIWIFKLIDTQDEIWVKSLLENFSSDIKEFDCEE
jgi:hypothetical protein